MAMTMTDDQIKRDVLDVLRNDVRVDATNITAEVRNGEVHLSGMVGTYAQKLTAGTDAQRIKGVRDVRNDLSVTLARTFSDEEIANTIRGNLARDARLPNAQTIRVSVARGVVTLSGEAGGHDQKAAAVDDAWTAPGVIDVVDEIQVKSGVVRNDEQLAAAARDAIAGDPGLDSSNLKVSAVNGTIYLRGTVPTYYQVQLAGNDARGVPGAANVVNELGVSF